MSEFTTQEVESNRFSLLNDPVEESIKKFKKDVIDLVKQMK